MIALSTELATTRGEPMAIRVIFFLSATRAVRSRLSEIVGINYYP